MPLWAEFDDPLVELDRDAPTHGNDHGLAEQFGASLLPMLDDVGGDHVEAVIGPYNGL